MRKLTEMGAEIAIHDPYVKHWWELEKQETYPAPGHSWSRFFRNQEKLKDSKVENDLSATLSKNIVEKLLKMFNIRAYRCINCGWRGSRIGNEFKQKTTARYSLLQIILIIFVTVLAVIVIFYYLTREEPRETISYRNTKKLRD